METIQFLRDQHKVLRGLMTQFEAVGMRTPEMCETVYQDLRQSFQIHSEIEESIFYPALREALPENERALIDMAMQTHSELLTTLPESLDSLDQVEDFISTFRTHLDDEENTLFMHAEKLLVTRDADLHQQMATRFKDLKEPPTERGEQNRINAA